MKDVPNFVKAKGSKIRLVVGIDLQSLPYGAMIVHSISETFIKHHTFGCQIWSAALMNLHKKIVWFVGIGGR